MSSAEDLFQLFFLEILFAIVGFLILLVAGVCVIIHRITHRSSKALLLVAKRHYPKGTIIKEPGAMFEFREIVLRDAPLGFINDLGELQDQALANDLRKGEVVQMMFLQKSGTKPKQEYGQVRTRLSL
jgi:hypothetical protein